MPLLMGLLPWKYQGGPGKRGYCWRLPIGPTGARNRRAAVVKAAADDTFMTHPSLLVPVGLKAGYEAPFLTRGRCHLTWIFRGFTHSAFGRVSVSTPSFISAVILCSSMLLGERLKLRR